MRQKGGGGSTCSQGRVISRWIWQRETAGPSFQVVPKPQSRERPWKSLGARRMWFTISWAQGFHTERSAAPAQLHSSVPAALSSNNGRAAATDTQTHGAAEAQEQDQAQIEQNQEVLLMSNLGKKKQAHCSDIHCDYWGWSLQANYWALIYFETCLGLLFITNKMLYLLIFQPFHAFIFDVPEQHAVK